MKKPFDLRRDAQLFWVSCFMLFFEILMIRWLSAEIRIFAYFHNMILLFCFLGFGLGCVLSKRRHQFLISFIVLFIVALLLAFNKQLGIFSLEKISYYLSLGSGFLIWFKPEPAPLLTRLLALLAGSGLLLFCMGLLVLLFIPFGQLLGKLLDEHEQPLRAYGINLFGSLAGIWLFNGLALNSLPPMIWVAVGGFCSLAFLLRKNWQAILAVILIFSSMAALYEKKTPEKFSIWSPYQKLSVEPAYAFGPNLKIKFGYYIFVNNVGFMQVSNYNPEFIAKFPALFPTEEIPYDHYNIPYRFADKLDDVLVVGSGAGNDVAGALRNGAKSVTAVEIDPVIIELGNELHPEAPYRDPRVTVINNDARSYFKYADKKFDVVVFGLLDSHTLSSSYSNVRLDNYVYTMESFQEVRRLLKPGGIVVIIFVVSDPYIGARIKENIAAAFEQEPITLDIKGTGRGWGGSGFVVGDQTVIAQSMNRDSRLRRIVDESKDTFKDWGKFNIEKSTDDWPYLYLEHNRIPSLYFLIFGLLLVFSYLGIRIAAGKDYRLQWHFFFLGAAFLLLEVQNISKLALLFGTTWTVNGIVISAVLIMIMLANYLVIKVRIGSLRPYYLALLASLIINYFLPLARLGGMSMAVKIALVGCIMTLPIFFAGIIFSTSFSRAEARAGVFASNLFGAILGGMLECSSFIIGVKSLLILAGILYGLSLITMKKS